jgi:predicted DNA-binding transcriptional regulator AlpA
MAKVKTDKTVISSALQNFDLLPDSANVRLPVVMGLTGLSAASVWRRVHDGKLPRGRKWSERCTTFNVGELRRALKPAAQPQA